MSSFADQFLSRQKIGSFAKNQEKIRLLLALLSPIQKRFVLSKHRFKVARCGRRSGKSFAISVYAILECLLVPNTPILYAGLTRDSAKEAVWTQMVVILEELGIPCKPKESALQISFPNGSKITLFGCDMQNARNRLRSRKYKVVFFDETGFFSSLDPLVFAVLPMLADYAGTLVFASSPGMLLQGIFYEADQGNRQEHWDRYTWTIHDNPHFAKPALDSKYKTRAEEELAIMLSTQYGGNANHPEYRREWLGEWVRDESALVYPIGPVNLVEPYKMRAQEHAFGVNFAHPFVQSIVIGRYSPYDRRFQFVDEFDYEDITIDEFAEKLEQKVDEYKPTVVVGHMGQYTTKVADEFRRRYKLPLIAMEGRDTSYYQRTFASDLAAGYIQMKPGLRVAAHCATIVKDNSGEEIAGQVNYAANAALAVYRKVYQSTLQTFEPPKTEEERHIEQLESQVEGETAHWSER